MDEFDRKILRVLQRDGRITNQQLADEIGLSPAASWRRVKVLEESGVIRGYKAHVDPQSVNLGMCVLLNVSLTRHAKDVSQHFIDAVKDRPEVLQCWALTGDYDFTLRVVSPDMAAFDHFLQDFIFTIPGVSQVKSNIALRQIKDDTTLPI